MRQRSYIKSRIIEAWKLCVTQDYCEQRINSERSLQSSLWSHLHKVIEEDGGENKRIFIEPTITIHTNTKDIKIRPDIVICNTKHVIAIIEIKYLPRGKPKYEKDIRNLALIERERKGIKIHNNRYQGIKKDNTVYDLYSNILYVWAGFYSKNKNETDYLFSRGFNELSGCYLQLQAETESELEPKILVNNKSIKNK